MDMPENVATSIQAWESGGLTTCFGVPWPAPERGSEAAAAETATIATARVIVDDMATPFSVLDLCHLAPDTLTIDVQSRATT
jgi:hypothetical protein